MTMKTRALTNLTKYRKKKKIQVQGEIIPQPGGFYTSKFRHAKLQYNYDQCCVKSFNTIDAKL